MVSWYVGDLVSLVWLVKFFFEKFIENFLILIVEFKFYLMSNFWHNDESNFEYDFLSLFQEQPQLHCVMISLDLNCIYCLWQVGMFELGLVGLVSLVGLIKLV